MTVMMMAWWVTVERTETKKHSKPDGLMFLGTCFWEERRQKEEVPCTWDFK